jgi:hypothetical protein
MQHDIALIKLTEPVELTKHTQIACLPKAGTTFSNLTDFTYGFEAGWSSSSRSNSNTMQNTLKFMYNESMCANLYPEREKNWDAQFCAGN